MDSFIHRNHPRRSDILHMFVYISPFTQPHGSRSHSAAAAVKVWKIVSFSLQL